MILADTSVWIDHFRRNNPLLATLRDQGRILGHPFVLGELALGTLRQHATVLGAFRALPQSTVASDDEVLGLIEREALPGAGLGYIEAHLLAAARLSAARLWTRDKRLAFVASQLGAEAHLPS